MLDKLSSAEFDPSRTPTDRLFFAIFPNASSAARISLLARRLGREHGLKGKQLATERFHATLLHVGDYQGLPNRLVDAASEAAAAVAMPPFDVEFDRALSFFRRVGKRPLVLRGDEGVVELIAFQQTIHVAMQKAGVAAWAQPRFTPHVTLLYDEGMVAEQAVEAIGWTVREFVLVHSLLGQTRHIPLGRWPLLG